MSTVFNRWPRSWNFFVDIRRGSCFRICYELNHQRSALRV
ncbi:hypothetical protein KP509_07G057900 [Ceratopteris richardii]|uniref:Uncharacterized protein n=1 Tax=Ceratopteris richardii TaxID=49495 RepID=A0A8T2UA92_CERRI|nr:hypothetical protein KP509_07G057900 [Ceratopteris richardii]